MRHSFGSALFLTFSLGIFFGILALNEISLNPGVEAYAVVFFVMAFFALLYVLYKRYVMLHSILENNYLDYLSINLDGVNVCESLAKRCDTLRHQRNSLSDDIIGYQVQLQEQNELSRMLLDRMPMPTILVNQKGLLLGINQSAQFLTGYYVDDVFGTSLEKLQLIDDLTMLSSKGWSQQLAARISDLSTPHYGELRVRSGKSIKCSWSIVELNLPIHRYYLITFSLV